MAQPNNTTTTVSQLSFGERLSIGLLYSCASLAGITLHILAISAAFKVKRASKSTFHILLVNVSASEVSIFVVYSLYAAPCVFVGTKVLGESFNLLVSLFQQGAFLTATYSALLIAINRAVAIRRVQAVEANRKTRFRWAVAAVCTWAAAALAIGVNTQFFCWAMFDLGKGVFRSVCVKSIQNSQLTPTPIINNTIIYGVALVYAWCVFRIWRQKKSVQAASSQKQISVYQMRLVYQAIFIWVGMAMNPIGKHYGVHFRCNKGLLNFFSIRHHTISFRGVRRGRGHNGDRSSSFLYYPSYDLSVLE